MRTISRAANIEKLKNCENMRNLVICTGSAHKMCRARHRRSAHHFLDVELACGADRMHDRVSDFTRRRTAAKIRCPDRAGRDNMFNSADESIVKIMVPEMIEH